MRASDITDYTPSGRLLRWHLLDGHPRCPLDPVDPWRIPDADVAAILEANTAVRATVEAVTAYEDATALLARYSGEGAEPPPETIAGDDGDDVPNPEHEAYVAAQGVVASAAPETVALADLRAGRFPLDEETGEPVFPPLDPLPEDTVTLWEPVPAEIPAFHGRIVLRGAGLYDGAVAVIEAMTGMERAVAEEAFHGSNNWMRSSLLIAAFAAALDLDKETVNHLFRQAAAVQV